MLRTPLTTTLPLHNTKVNTHTEQQQSKCDLSRFHDDYSPTQIGSSPPEGGEGNRGSGGK